MADIPSRLVIRIVSVLHQRCVNSKTASSSSELRGNGGRMTNKGTKRILGGIALALVVSSWALVSAAPRVIDIEPEQCQTRCYYFMGVPIYCYEICF
jgi:hypothetical protein